MIELKQISFRYPRQTNWILQDFSLQINAGQRIALTGSNGSGKTTTLKILAGLLFPFEGSYWFHEEQFPCALQSAAVFRRNHIGIMTQQDSLLENKTGEENVALPLLFQKMSQKQIANRTRPLFEHVNAEYLRTLYPDEMSGGEKQIVSFLRSVIIEPRLLLLDEPSTFLDSVRIGQLLDFLTRLTHSETSAVIVTHDKALLPLCDRVVTLHKAQ